VLLDVALGSGKLLVHGADREFWCEVIAKAEPRVMLEAEDLQGSSRTSLVAQHDQDQTRLYSWPKISRDK
jgi:hypothetical protein